MELRPALLLGEAQEVAGLSRSRSVPWTGGMSRAMRESGTVPHYL
jgi:hypothetical protein